MEMKILQGQHDVNKKKKKKKKKQRERERERESSQRCAAGEGILPDYAPSLSTRFNIAPPK